MIYATPFTAIDKQCTGPSLDAGFDTLDTVVNTIGEPLVSFPRMVIYGDDVNRVVFSDDVIFQVDEQNNND